VSAIETYRTQIHDWS